jgi:hypothetical protein
MSSAVTSPSECLNCGAPLAGEYCAVCGQKLASPNPTLHELLHEFTHELLHVDVMIFRSVGLLLLLPGLLTREYVVGRRTRYVPPLRLYLVFSVLYFAVAAIAPPTGGRASVINFTYEPDAKEPAAAKAEEERDVRKLGFASEEELVEAVREAMAHQIPKVMFLLVPLSAALAGLTLRRASHRFPHHLIFAVHVHAAWFAMAAVQAATGWIRWPYVAGAISLATLLHRVWYVPAAFRAAYGTTRAGAIWRAAVVALVYFLALLAAIGGIVWGVILMRQWTSA